MEEHDEFNEEQTGVQLFFNSPDENPYSALMLNSKIAQRSKIFDDLCAGNVDIVDALAELQNVDDSIINELIQGHGLAEAWQQEALKWKQQAELLQARFNQFRSTHF